MRVMTILVVLLLALMGAGCGGGDDEASSDTDTTVVTETTTDDTTTDETTTDDDDSDTDTDTDTDVSGFLSGDCQELVAAYSALGQAFAAASAGGDDLDASSEAFEAFADEAPDEIRGDIEILAAAYAEYADLISDLDFEPGAVPDAEAIQALEAASASLNDSEITAASERLTAWTNENCG